MLQFHNVGFEIKGDKPWLIGSRLGVKEEVSAQLGDKGPISDGVDKAAPGF
jgi:hypothetical protein